MKADMGFALPTEAFFSIYSREDDIAKVRELLAASLRIPLINVLG